MPYVLLWTSVGVIAFAALAEKPGGNEPVSIESLAIMST